MDAVSAAASRITEAASSAVTSATDAAPGAAAAAKDTAASAVDTASAAASSAAATASDTAATAADTAKDAAISAAATASTTAAELGNGIEKTQDGPLFTAPAGEGDDLQKINGVGPVAERQLKEQGITTYAQIAGLTPEEVQKVDDYMPFSTAQVQDWKAQAAELAK